MLVDNVLPAVAGGADGTLLAVRSMRLFALLRLEADVGFCPSNLTLTLVVPAKRKNCKRLIGNRLHWLFRRRHPSVWPNVCGIAVRATCLRPRHP